MIRTLTLTDFGKFRGVTFDLAPVTLVWGPNEAGKTTFFDGLFQALCKPSETKNSGKLLKKRYGPNRKASVILSEGNPITDEEFLDLFAIRAGDLQLELSQGSDWMEKLKARLFHGGLDPAVLAEEFERLSSDKRNYLHNRKIDEFRAAAAKARQELEARRRERDAQLGLEKSLGDLEASLGETRRLREAAEGRLRDLDRDLAFEDRIALRQRLSAHLARLEEWEALEKGVRELAAFQDARREDWERLSGNVGDAGSKLRTERGKREWQAELVAKARAEARSLQDAQAAAGIRSLAAGKLAEAVRAALAAKSDAGRPLQIGFAGACLAMILGSLGAFLMRGFAALLSLLFGLLTAGACAFTGWRGRRHIGKNGSRQNLDFWKDQWRTALSDGDSTRTDGASLKEELAAIGEIATPEGFLQAMENRAREKETLRLQEQDASRRLRASEEALELLDRSILVLKDEEEDARRAEKKWLDGLGVASGEEFLQKLSRLHDARAELPKRKAELDALIQDQDPSAFGRESFRKLQTLDEEGVPARGLDEAGVQRLRREHRELLIERERLGKEERDLIARTKELAGGIHATLGKLAGEIVEWEDRTAAAEAEIQARELDKRAAALALEIFRGIGDGADALLAGLAQEMETMLGHILPDGRGVSLQGLADGQMQVRDAGGGNRLLDNLSTGTKDAVVLAAKLALALKSREGAGILVLDEPFLAMDDARESRALELLRNFHGRHGWQIIILSKDARLRDKVLGLFHSPLIVDLGALPVT